MTTVHQLHRFLLQETCDKVQLKYVLLLMDFMQQNYHWNVQFVICTGPVTLSHCCWQTSKESLLQFGNRAGRLQNMGPAWQLLLSVQVSRLPQKLGSTQAGWMLGHIYIYTIYGQFTCSTNYLVRFPDPLVKTKLGNLLHTSLYGLLTATGWKTRWIGRAVRPIWCSCDITQNFLVVCCLAKRKSGRWDSVFSDKWEHGQLFLILMHIRKYDHIEVCREVIYGSRMVPNTARLVRLRAVPQGDWR